jgi:hypothetical protein
LKNNSGKSLNSGESASFIKRKDIELVLSGPIISGGTSRLAEQLSFSVDQAICNKE